MVIGVSVVQGFMELFLHFLIPIYYGEKITKPQVDFVFAVFCSKGSKAPTRDKFKGNSFIILLWMAVSAAKRQVLVEMFVLLSTISWKVVLFVGI